MSALADDQQNALLAFAHSIWLSGLYHGRESMRLREGMDEAHARSPYLVNGEHPLAIKEKP